MKSNIVKHKKSGRMYEIIHDNVIECTNGREGRQCVVYANSYGQVFFAVSMKSSGKSSRLWTYV